MPTTKRRINISLPNQVDAALKQLARRDHVPTATKALGLIQSALETEEDIVLDRIAQARDTEDAKFVAHNKV